MPVGNGKPFVSPVVARSASEHGVDPSEIEGTCRGGRVTKKDILAFVESGPTAPATPEVAETPAAAPQPAAAAAPASAAPPAAAAPATPPPPPAAAPLAPAPPPLAQPPQPPLPVAETLPGETVEPVTAMRRGIADHMRRSLDTSAHVTSAIEVDMSRVVSAREQLKQEYQAAYGVNPTYLAFIAKATVELLRDFPYLNGELRGDSIVTRTFVNLSIAVELADGKGLIVPVIRNAETLNLLGVAKESRTSPHGRARRGSPLTTSMAAPSRSRTRAATAPSTGRRSSASPRRRSSAPTRSSSGHGWSRTSSGGNDRDPPDHEHHVHLRPSPDRRRIRGPLPAVAPPATRELGGRRRFEGVVASRH